MKTEFLWATQDGEILTPEEMETTHLFYVIRMIYNHTAPQHLRLPGGHWQSWEEAPKELKIETLRVMGTELLKRDDLPTSLDIQLGIMRDRCCQFAAGRGLLT
jgi:hypothetical protein